MSDSTSFTVFTAAIQSLPLKRVPRETFTLALDFETRVKDVVKDLTEDQLVALRFDAQVLLKHELTSKCFEHIRADLQAWAGNRYRRALRAVVAAATAKLTGRVKCDRCDGTKVYSRGTVNGVPQIAGPCYRCAGKGYQTPEDEARNERYDAWSASRAVAADERQQLIVK